MPRRHAVAWSVFLLAALIAGAGSPARAQSSLDVVGFTSNLFVPDARAPMGGMWIEYRISAVPLTSRKSRFLFSVRNNATDNKGNTINFAVCYMQGLNQPFIDHDAYTMEKTGGNWVCSDAPDAFVMGDNAPPSFHFGCKRVTLAPGEELLIENTVINWNQDYTPADLGKVYVDFLIDCPLVGCAQVRGGLNWLYPSKIAQRNSWANVWGGQWGAFQDLTRGGLTSETWPSQNWVIMQDFEGREFDAAFNGVLRGAPRGTRFTPMFNGQQGETFFVAADPANPPCGGLPLTFTDAALIPPDQGALDGYELELPDDACGDLPEQSIIRMDAEYVSDPSPPCVVEAALYQDFWIPMASLVQAGPGACGAPYWAPAEAEGVLDIDGNFVAPPAQVCGYGQLATTPTDFLDRDCLYQAGEKMHNVASVLVKDTTPPQAPVPPTAAVTGTGELTFRAVVSDATTLAVGAVLRYIVNDGALVTEAMEVARPLTEHGGPEELELVVAGLSEGDLVLWQVEMIDEFGNSAFTGFVATTVAEPPFFIVPALSAGALVMLAAGLFMAMRRNPGQ